MLEWDIKNLSLPVDDHRKCDSDNLMKQGGSVMRVRTLSSDPAHLHFSLNCLPNEEEIKNIAGQVLTYNSKNFH